MDEAAADGDDTATGTDTRPVAAPFRSRAELMRWVPLTLFTTAGELRLGYGRLTFTPTRGEPLLDAPVGEVHSVARAATGLYLWHGAEKYRFALGRSSGRAAWQADGLLDVVGSVGRAVDDRDRDRVARRLADQWIEVLSPLIGEPGPGQRVPKPWPLWAWWVGIFAIPLVLIAIFVLIGTLAG